MSSQSTEAPASKIRPATLAYPEEYKPGQKINSQLQDIPLLVLLSILISAFLLIGVSGEFPSNDDHLYANAVKSIVQTGVFSIAGSNAFDFIPIQLGAFVCKTLGFSFEALRWTTLSFHLLGVIGLYLALKELKTTPLNAAILSAAYAFNPFLLNLSLSFMTDVPALAVTNWSFYFALAAVNRSKFGYWLLSLLVLAAAMSIRQTALYALPTIAVFGFFTLKKPSDRLLLLSSLLVFPLAYICLHKWLMDGTAFPSCYSSFSTSITGGLLEVLLHPKNLFEMLLKGLCYTGIFILPITAPSFCLLIGKIKPKKLALSLLVACITVVSLLRIQLNGAYMPYSLNMFLPPILGAYCLIGGVPFWGFEQLKQFTYFSDLAAMLASMCFATAILHFAESKRSANLMAICFGVCATAAVIAQLVASNFDRYYIIALAPLILMLAPLWNHFGPKNTRILSVVLSLGLLTYGVIAALDVMNFARAQWATIRQLEQIGIPAENIDGGPNHVLQLAHPIFVVTFKQGVGWPEERRGRKATRKLRWWPVLNERYVVSTILLKGYHQISHRRYFSPLAWKYRDMYALEINPNTN